MKILSIDVGIKNLSFCLFEKDGDQLQILKWDNINLSETVETKCIEIDKNGALCGRPGKFIKDDNCYCLKHSKKHAYLQPTKELTLAFLNKQKISNLIELATKYNIHYESQTKAQLLNAFAEFIKANCYTVVEKTNASKMDLVTIGRNIQKKFDDYLGDASSINTIIIENQIGPIANKMKTIQGMIAQYFIMKNNNIHIEFISATNKLKDFLGKTNINGINIDQKKKIEYKDRKKLGIQICLEFVSTDDRFKCWAEFFNKHSKKDDLSDCFLQGMWFIKQRM